MVQGDETSTEITVQTPLIHSGNETWAPAGIAFINQGPLSGNLLVANLRGQQLLNISLNRNGNKVTNVESLFKNEYGRLRDVFYANDGSIYITTSNRDGVGNPDMTDDKILRLIPQ